MVENETHGDTLPDQFAIGTEFESSSQAYDYVKSLLKGC